MWQDAIDFIDTDIDMDVVFLASKEEEEEENISLNRELVSLDLTTFIIVNTGHIIIHHYFKNHGPF